MKRVKQILLKSLAIMLLVTATSSAMYATNTNPVKSPKLTHAHKPGKQSVNTWWFWHITGVNDCAAWLRASSAPPYSCVSCAPSWYWTGTIAVNTHVYQNTTLTLPVAAGTYFAYGPTGYGPYDYMIVVDSTGKVVTFNKC